jgi:tetratricopeptide (TPR) repeat protein
MTSTSSSRRGLQVDWRRGLIPLSLFILVILHFGLRAPWWVLAVFCLWIPMFYVGFPIYLSRRWEAFEKNFAQRFQRGEHRTLLEEYRKERFLRRFGPRAEMLSRLGLIYSALEKYQQAEQAFEGAIAAAEGGIPEQLYFNLANVKFELGHFDEAMKIYLTLRGNSPYQRAARTQMALIDLHKGMRVEQAREFLRDEKDRATGSMRDRIEAALAAERP